MSKKGGDFWRISEIYHSKSWAQIKILVLKEFQPIEAYPKGQLISKGNFGVFNSSKKRT